MEINKSKHRSLGSKDEDSNRPLIVGFDLSFQGIKSVSGAMFINYNLKELYLNNNNIEEIPNSIILLKSLEKLDLSHNKIKSIPIDLFKCINLRDLNLSDNMISSVPLEIGNLYKMESLNLSNNPLIQPFFNLYKEGNLLQFCRDNNSNYKAPSTRIWVDSGKSVNPDIVASSFTVGTFNILANFYAEKCTYAPIWVTSRECRKDTILKTISLYDLDIIGLQEIEGTSYYNAYRDFLFTNANYNSSFYNRPTMIHQNENRLSDGCAIFWKNDKFILIEEVKINYLEKLIKDPRVGKNSSLIGIYNNKNHIGLITVLQTNTQDILIIANTHLFWDPGYDEIRIIQLYYLLEEIIRLRKKYSKGKVVMIGDFNSQRSSVVYKTIIEKFFQNNYFGNKDLAFLNDGFKHSLNFTDAYEDEDGFTTFTPAFIGSIDYIFYSDGLIGSKIISLVEKDYTKRTIGLPNIHFPSDHIILAAKLFITSSKKQTFYSNYK